MVDPTPADRSPLLLTGAVLQDPDGAPHPGCVAIEGGRIVHVGPPGSASAYAGERVLDLDGRLLTPAFVDAHVHAVRAGEVLTGLDLTGVESRQQLLEEVARHAAGTPRGRVVTAAGWDESLWADPSLPTAAELERAAPGVPLLLARIDGHSAIASTALLARVPAAAAAEGYDESGRLERDAKLAVTVALAGLVGPEERLDAARAAVAEMARLGIASFHEAGAPHIGPDAELGLVRAAAEEVGLHPVLYWGARLAFDDVERLGVRGLAGDLNADGALGSRTAALCAPYTDEGEHSGHAFLDAREVAEHVVGCTRRGIQAGFHCIGDAALDAVGEGFERAAAEVGVAALRACRHRLEHVEMASAAVLRVLARCGVVASVQPVFDALWGGPDLMYAERLGDRWPHVNRFADLAAAGVTLAFGSDSPVTPLGPWAAVAAAVRHRTPGQGLPLAEAFAAHTRGGWRAAHVDDAGDLRPGQRACLAAWDADRFPEPGEAPGCALTVVDGRPVHASGVD